MMKKSPPTKTREPLERTSVQLPRQAITILDEWPGLNRSEALRATVDRYQYLEVLCSVRPYSLVEEYRPVFHIALQDASFDHFRFVVKSLGAMIEEAMTEPSAREAVRDERTRSGAPEINWTQLRSDVASLDPLSRILVLDCVVMDRYRNQEAEA